jgi:hypothetical protein
LDGAGKSNFGEVGFSQNNRLKQNAHACNWSASVSGSDAHEENFMSYAPANSRYDNMQYRRCGRSGLLLPAISLGLWHNFGGVDSFENCRAMQRRNSTKTFFRG